MTWIVRLIAIGIAVLAIAGCIQTGSEIIPAAHNSSGLSLQEQPATEKNLSEMTAEDIAGEFIAHEKTIASYSATVRVTGETGLEDEEYLFSARRPDRFRAEFIRSAIHGNGTLVVANETMVWQYHPDTGTAVPSLIEDPANTFFAWRDYPAIAAGIFGKFPAARVTTGVWEDPGSVFIETTVDGMPTDYFPMLFSGIRIGIDGNTRAMTSMELIGEDNRTVLAVAIRTISINPDLPDGLFDFAPPAGTKVTPGIGELFAPQNASSLYLAKARFGRSFLLPASLPEGYTFRNGLHYRDSDGRDSLVYSNGTANLVFTQLAGINGTSPETLEGQDIPVPTGSGTAFFRARGDLNQIRWNEGNSTCWLTGTLSREELVKVARSVTAPALVNLAPDQIMNPEEIARLALNDPSARKMTGAGGEVLGVRMAVKRGTRDTPGGVYPALVIRYNGLTVDFMADPASGKVAGRTVEVPNGAMINHTENGTTVEYRGEVLFVFDPVPE